MCPIEMNFQSTWIYNIKNIYPVFWIHEMVLKLLRSWFLPFVLLVGFALWKSSEGNVRDAGETSTLIVDFSTIRHKDFHFLPSLDTLVLQ